MPSSGMMMSSFWVVFVIVQAKSTGKGRSTGNRVNKHTYSSNDGWEDYAFINTYFCPADTSSASFQCAVDMKASCDGFDVHMVQSWVTNNGSQTPDEWFSYMSALHGAMKSWDQFMHYGTTFHAHDLSDHLEKFQADGVPFMARKTSSDTPLYSLLVQTPSAKIMEIVSTKAPNSYASLFVEWKNDECPVSHERSLSEIETFNQNSEQSRRLKAYPQYPPYPPPSPSPELPTLTAIGVNIAASAQTVNEITAWLEKYGISGSASTLHNTSSCAVASITYSNAEVRYVSNPGARVGSKTVEQYEEMQMAVHKQYVGKGTGWDAWMDNHWCVGVSHSKHLDSIAKKWANDGVNWHAHTTPLVSSVRSVGLRGESIELNGLIDGSYLNKLSGFDFCTADTEPSDVAESSAKARVLMVV
jgi:hypothetical protein